MSEQSSTPSHNQKNLEHKKRRRGQSRTNPDTARFQCYCDKIYLSYPALYLHLKNKHPECFLNNRKIQVTKFKESMTPEGFKLMRIQKDANDMGKHDAYSAEQVFKNKNVQNPFPYPMHLQSFPYSQSHNFMMPGMVSQPYYMESGLNPINPIQMPKKHISSIPMPSFNPIFQSIPKRATETKPQSESHVRVPKAQKEDIYTVINQYIEQKVTEDQLQKREVMQMQLLYSLLPKSIRETSEKYPQLQSSGMKGEDLIKSTNLKYLETMLPFFKNRYLKSLKDMQECKDDAGLNQEQKTIKRMLMVNRYFNDSQMMERELERFQKWLVGRKLIQGVHKM